MPRLFTILALLMLCVAGCARNNDRTWKAPMVYRVDIQQGNVVDQGMINKLKSGMDKKQVKYIMGTPLITDTFHSDRWDYVYSFEPGKGERQQRRVTLYFAGDKLARVEGDIKVSDKPLMEEEQKKDRTVAVPLENDKPGFFKRMFSWKKNTKEEKGSGLSETEAPATEPAVETKAEPVTKNSTTDTPKADTQQQPADDSGNKTASSPETPATTAAKDKTKVQSTAGDTGERNLLRRFWDRMTKSSIKNSPDQDEVSEQTRRDAEVLESTDSKP